MIFPIRCFTCGSLTGNKIRLYEKKVKEKKNENPKCFSYGDILDTLNIKRYCCRSLYISYTPMTEILSNPYLIKKELI